jgi:hypothetical protein
MDKETKRLIGIIENQLYKTAKDTYLYSSKNNFAVKGMLFRTFLKHLVNDLTQEKMKSIVVANYEDILKNNDEFTAMVNLKKDNVKPVVLYGRRRL